MRDGPNERASAIGARMELTMEPVYDRGGRVGWRVEDDFVDRHGQYKLFVVGENVYRYAGGFAGWFVGGVLWSPRGNAVTFVSDATGLPSQPFPECPACRALVVDPGVLVGRGRRADPGLRAGLT